MKRKNERKKVNVKRERTNDEDKNIFFARPTDSLALDSKSIIIDWEENDNACSALGR